MRIRAESTNEPPTRPLGFIDRLRVESLFTRESPTQADMLSPSEYTSPRVTRCHSLPVTLFQNTLGNCHHNIFPDVSPRSLRIAEVKSWARPWIKQPLKDVSVRTDDIVLDEVETHQTEEKPPPPPSTGRKSMLKLKLENMPTPQEAEERAQRAANRLIARSEAAAGENGSVGTTYLRLHLASPTSDSDVASSPDGRHSQWSPTHGRFTTTTVSVSEHGIASPDSAYLHLQNDLVRVREVGRGASGVVHQAIHVPTLNLVAVKDIPVYGKGQRRQMVRELQALNANLVPIKGIPDSNSEKSKKKKTSPYIVSFYDAFVDKSRSSVSLVMQYMGMGSLQSIVVKGGCSNEIVLSRMAFCVLKGLSHIHAQRMIHRDIKPHNLLMSRFGDVKISDFGLATTFKENATKTKTFVGTLLYMAPERIGGGDYSYAADVWSFGLSLVAVALGRYPLPTEDGFFGLVDSVSTSHEEYLTLPEDQFSEDCRSFINQCLQIDPEVRGTANELLFHPFITKHKRSDYMTEWHSLADTLGLLKPAEKEIMDLAEAVYKHIYTETVKFSSKTQSEIGHGLVARVGGGISSRNMTIRRVEKSLQMGLAAQLNAPVELVFRIFEKKREIYVSKLLEAQCFSPQSWTASPGYARRQQLLGSDEDSDSDQKASGRPSFWRRFRQKLKGRRFKTVGGNL